MANPRLTIDSPKVNMLVLHVHGPTIDLGHLGHNISNSSHAKRKHYSYLIGSSANRGQQLEQEDTEL